MLRSNPYVISTAATQIYTLSLHDALPIYLQTHPAVAVALSQDQLKLHAWVYEISSGEVFSYDDSSQQFLPLGEVRPTSAVMLKNPSAHLADVRSGDGKFHSDTET